MKVLIVEHSAIIRERLRAMISEVPEIKTISQAKDSLEAVELLHKLNPEVVIMDIQMPGGSGIDALREIKKGNRPPLVIVFTSESYPQYREQCSKAGADFFFDKSTEFDKVAEVLNQLTGINLPEVNGQRGKIERKGGGEMKALVVYDSVYGNTEKIAKAIGGAIAGEVKVLRPGEVNPSDWGTLDVLIVGSPTQNGKATKVIKELSSKIPANALKNVSVAAFDTRYGTPLVKLFGYAGGRIADILKDKGGRLAVPPEGFIVKGQKGPLKEGELERAALWAKEIVKSLSFARA